MNKNLKILLSTVLPFLIIAIRPFAMSIQQAIILACVVLVVTWWTLILVNKSISSITLIVVFLIFSNSNTQTILKFPLSLNIILIIASFLLAHGIMKSGLAERVSNSILYKNGSSGIKMIQIAFIISFLLIFFIPQTFPRAIITASIFTKYLKEKEISEKQRSILLFSVFVAISATSMCFINGDVVLNNAILQFANLSMTWNEWTIYMLIPASAISFLMYISYITLFKKDIKNIVFEINKLKTSPFSDKEKKAGVITIITILLWMTEGIHGIHSAYVSLLGVILMLVFQLIKISDFKVVKIELLLFLTAAFSIGSVLNSEGIVEMILTRFLPQTSNIFLFILFSIGLTMVLHMILGSSMTSLSVCIPILLAVAPSTIKPEILTLIIYVTINIHYLLPFQHVLIMIGEGEGYYDSKLTIKYGVVLTFIVFIAIFLIQIPYWQITGLF